MWDFWLGWHQKQHYQLKFRGEKNCLPNSTWNFWGIDASGSAWCKFLSRPFYGHCHIYFLHLHLWALLTTSWGLKVSPAHQGWWGAHWQWLSWSLNALHRVSHIQLEVSWVLPSQRAESICFETGVRAGLGRGSGSESEGQQSFTPGYAKLWNHSLPCAYLPIRGTSEELLCLRDD